MKTLQKYITEAKNGIIEGLKPGETIYIWCPSKSDKPVQVKIKDIEKFGKGQNYYITLDKEVFGSNAIDYSVASDGARGMRDSEIKNSDPVNSPIYNGRLDDEENPYNGLQVIFARSKEEIKDMVDSSYADKLAAKQKEAEELYSKYEKKINEIREFVEKMRVDLSDDDPENLG